jgi:hypothetical protein
MTPAVPSDNHKGAAACDCRLRRAAPRASYHHRVAHCQCRVQSGKQIFLTRDRAPNFSFHVKQQSVSDVSATNESRLCP